MNSKMKITFKKSFNLILLPLFFVAILTLGSLTANAAGGVYINDKTFPDKAFQDYIKNNFEVVKEGNKTFISNETLKGVTVINLNGTKVANLTGIERFPNLKKLNCMQTNLSSLDLSNNKYLEELKCSNCPNLTQLNLTNNTNLKTLWCQANNINQLNITKNKKLVELNCRGNNLYSLNVTGNPALKKLECHNNHLSTLNLANNKKLTYLSCYGNNLSALDLSANTALTELYCNNNPKLSSLNVTKCIKLKYIDCSSCKLSSINFDENVNLLSVYCQNNSLTVLSLNDSRNLKELYCYKNKIGVIQFDREGKMKEFDKNKNKKVNKLSDGTDQYSISGGDPYLWKDRSASIAYVTNNRIQPSNPTVNKEAIRSFVASFYYDVLERKTIDQKELDNWTDNLAAHKVTSAEIARGFFLGDEFKGRNFKDDVFVEKLYVALLGRDSDANGKKSHLNALKGGASREDIVAGFANSPEFKQRCTALGILYGQFKIGSTSSNTRHFVIDASHVNDAALDAYVERLYVQVLGRPSDAAGKNHWKEGIKAGTNYDAVTVARIGFFGSAEYINRHTSDEQFITDAYHAFLGREPDAAGFANWKNQLQVNKMSRDFMLDVGFGTSEEFKNLLESYGFKVTVVN